MLCWKKFVREKNRKGFEKWRQEVVAILLKDVFPIGTPYQYDTVLSFIQHESLDLASPIRTTLFLPEIPLAIDVLGPESYSEYRGLDKYLTFDDWKKGQEKLSRKKRMFNRYSCPYLQVWYSEATDSQTLSEKIKSLVGFYPK